MNQPRTDVYQFQAQLGQRLATWSGFSIGAAAVMALLGGKLWRGAASQFAGWGVINLMLALLGLNSAQNGSAAPAAHAIEQQSKTRANLRKFLWLNTGLDFGYVAGGAVLARTKGKSSRFWLGAGRGIIVQGGVLVLFDLIHARLLRD